MRSEADARLVERDRALPGLACLLDPGQFAAALRTLPGLHDVDSAEHTYLRYKPGTSCLAAYRIRRGDGSVFLISAKALTEARFARSLDKPRWQAARRDDDEQEDAPRILHDARALLSTPQHDRQLPALRTLADPKRAATLLRRLLAATPHAEAIRADIEHWSLHRHTLRWKPGRRWVGRLDLGQPHPGLVLRAGASGNFGQSLLGATVASAHDGGARLLGADADTLLFATAWTPGESICPQAHGGRVSIERVRQAGRLLARLHASPMAHPLRRRDEDEQAALARIVDDLHPLDQALAQRARATLRRLLVDATALPPTTPTLIHGDFSLDQVIDSGDRLHLIDWDRSAHGRPATDLGTCWARLEYQALHADLDAELAAQTVDTLLEGHAEQYGHRLPDARWQAAAALLRLSIEPFRQRLPDWPQRIDALLQRVDTLLNAGSSAARPIPNPARAPAIADIPALATALDPERMRSPIAAALAQDPAHTRVTAAHLLRHKPRRRALIEYTVQSPTGDCTLIGKLRAKGVDRHGFQVQYQLWQQRAQCPRFQVPEPLALLPEHALWLQRHAPGTAAIALMTPTGDTDIADAIARALAQFHQVRLDGERRWGIDDELQLLRARLDQAADARPALADRIRLLSDGSLALARQLPTVNDTWIHRDFHPDQVLIGNGVPVLLDFDLCALGDPALDAGNFIAHLIEFGLRRHANADALAPHIHAFTRQFLHDSPALHGDAVHIHTLLSLARHVYLSTRFDDRLHTTEPILTHCLRQLARD